MQWPFGGESLDGHCFPWREEELPGKFAGGTTVPCRGAENERTTSAKRAQNVCGSLRVSFRVSKVAPFRVGRVRALRRSPVGVWPCGAVPRSPCRAAARAAADAVCR